MENLRLDGLLGPFIVFVKARVTLGTTHGKLKKTNGNLRNLKDNFRKPMENLRKTEGKFRKLRKN